MVATVKNTRVGGRELAEIAKGAGSRSEACHRVLAVIREGLKNGDFRPENVSMLGIGIAIGAVDPYDVAGSVRRCGYEAKSSERVAPEQMLSEANPGLLSNAFQIITGELVNFAVIEGFNITDGMIGDQLVTRVPVSLRNSRIPGVTALGGPSIVSEGHPYPETGFTDKYVSAVEYKKGVVISLSEELITLDQTGMAMMKARELGQAVRQEKERFTVRAVMDADSSTYPVYRPSGSGTSLYATSGALLNYIGSGGVTGYNAAITLEDWTDINTVLVYRATKVVDDRLDGTARPIAGINNNRCVLLVPEGKRATAEYIRTATTIRKNTNSAVDETNFGNPVAGRIGAVLSSPFVDEVNADNWFYGEFQRQFIETEIWPIQTFTQGADSESAFERDTIFRNKVRYYSGISARDTRYVTMVDGA